MLDRTRFRTWLPSGALSLAATLVSSGVATEAAATEKTYYEDRNEVPIEYRWDLSAIFPTVDAWEQAYKDLEADLPQLDQYRGRLGESAEVVAAAMTKQFALNQRFSDIYVYANEWVHTEADNATAKDLASRAQNLDTRLSEATSFIDPELAQLPDERLAEFLKQPDLQEFAHTIDNVVRTKQHLRSPEIEELIAAAGLPFTTSRRAFDALENSDIEWPTVKDEDGSDVKAVPGQYPRLVTSQNREVRRDAALALHETYGQFGNTFAATLGGNIQRDLWTANARGYESVLEMALNSTNVPVEVVETLVETVHDNIDMIHSYASLRKELLGVDELHPYDLAVNLIPGIEKTYTFEQGWGLAMTFWKETFGEEFAGVAERALQERWVDVYTTAGKRPGAYAWGTYNSHPYLLLNWSGKLEGVSTLVHEMGHAVHRYLADTTQPFQYSDYSLFVAEVASIASESLFLEWMFERSTDPDERKLLLNQAMNSISGAFVTQIFFHEWESEAHEMAQRGEPLTKESLDAIYKELFEQYYGPELVVDDAYAAGWSRISHFYRTYYVWVYATSYAAGESIAQRFRNGDKTAVDDYLAMLRLGGSVYPMDALKRAGVDMSDPEVIRAVMDRYGQLQKQLAEEMVGSVEVAATQ